MSRAKPSTRSAVDRLLAIAGMIDHNRIREPRRGPNRRPSLDRIARQIAGRERVSCTTVWRWYCLYQRGGLAALPSHPRRDKGSFRFFAKHPTVATLAARIHLDQQQSRASCYRAIQRDAASLGINLEELPSYETVRAFLARQRATLGRVEKAAR